MNWIRTDKGTLTKELNATLDALERDAATATQDDALTLLQKIEDLRARAKDWYLNRDLETHPYPRGEEAHQNWWRNFRDRLEAMEQCLPRE